MRHIPLEDATRNTVYAPERRATNTHSLLQNIPCRLQPAAILNDKYDEPFQPHQQISVTLQFNTYLAHAGCERTQHHVTHRVIDFTSTCTCWQLCYKRYMNNHSRLHWDQCYYMPRGYIYAQVQVTRARNTKITIRMISVAEERVEPGRSMKLHKYRTEGSMAP